MPDIETIERRVEQRQFADPDPIAALAEDRRGEEPSATLSSTIATGSGIALLCVMEGAWLWLLGTGTVWLFGGQ